MNSTLGKIGTKVLRFAAVALLAIGATATGAVAQSWTAHIDWAAANKDAGGVWIVPANTSKMVLNTRLLAVGGLP